MIIAIKTLGGFRFPCRFLWFAGSCVNFGVRVGPCSEQQVKHICRVQRLFRRKKTWLRVSAHVAHAKNKQTYNKRYHQL